MRVIAGKYRSRPLQSLRGLDIRPTSDRLRETLFNVLCAGNPDTLDGSVWVDLYAGTGAVGIEALSRGAAQVTLVERSRKATAVIEKNLKSLGAVSGFAVLCTDAADALPRLQAGGIRADYVFVDPPYRMREEYGIVLRALDESAVVTASTVVVVEHDRKFDLQDEAGGLKRVRKLDQGDSALSFYRRV